MNIPTSDEVRKRINAKINGLYWKENDDVGSYVCLLCDEFLNGNNVERISVDILLKNASLLIPEEWNAINSCVRKDYKVRCRHIPSTLSAADVDILEQMVLSPRAILMSAKNRREKKFFSCCAACKSSMSRNAMPKFAVVNNFGFGEPPLCLTELTDIELAFLTPVKTYGYCFSFTGGVQKQLKGSLSYYKVEIASIARSVMHFDVLGLNRNIVVLLYGKMTSAQNKRARERSKIRTDYVLRALQWLILNNEEWIKREVILDEIRQKLTNPVLIDMIDNSKVVESEQHFQEIEESEVFNVFFPDGTMSSSTGGQESLQRFNDLLQTASLNGYDIGMKTNLMKEAVQDFRDNNLVNACILQFPYGRGGMHEIRMNEQKRLSNNIDIERYVEHLSKVSQPHFHHGLFTLILYNLTMKQRMVRTAGWRVRNKCDARSLAHDLTIESVTEAINTRTRAGQKRKFGHDGEKLLNAVDAIARSVPHTNDAAKQARGSGECLQHHFGTPSIFLTVTPDDDNCYLIQVLTNEIIDKDSNTRNLSDAELSTRASQRTKLRIRFPGICALYFEYVLDIIAEEVIGWNVKEDKAREDTVGLFGKPLAFSSTIEEQGRGTLHSHMQIWVERFDELRQNLDCNNRNEARSAGKEIIKFVDSIGSCNMFFKNVPKSKKIAGLIFCHPCTVQCRRSSFPVVVGDQQLRNLRQKQSLNSENATFAICNHCKRSWKSEELLESYLLSQQIVPGLTKFPDNDVRRLKAMAIEYQKERNVEKRIDECIVDAAYNHHMHTKSCFERYVNGGDSKRAGRKKDEILECRYRYPQREQKQTVVENSVQDPIPWFLWDGTKTTKYIKEVRIKRGSYDLFQNTCCPAISYSNLTCNSNIMVVMPGPIAFYCFKYNLKGTQEDDSREYGNVKDATERTLSNARDFDSDFSEAIRRVLSASFAHQRSNVCGCPLASFLTRNKSRFRFSHPMVWCPLRDLEALLVGREANAMIISNGRVPFFVCSALHYLCRPEELESVNVFQFYSMYEVIKVSSRNRESLMEFCNSANFQHPSYNCKKESFLQGVRRRERVHLVKVLQYDFPDTAEFNGSLLDPDLFPNESMERYCRLALLLFIPFRLSHELVTNGSYTEKFRSCVTNQSIDDSAKQFLQNLQDSRSNSCRISGVEDDLQRVTKLQKLTHDGTDEMYVDTESIGDANNTDHFLQLLELEEENNSDESNEIEQYSGDSLPLKLSLSSLRNKGADKCGYSCLANMNIATKDLTESFLEIDTINPFQTTAEENVNDDEISLCNNNPTQHDIVTLLLTKTRKRRRSFEEITGRKEMVKVLDPNGSARSIIDWARKAKLDSGQRRAFEVLTSTFILTFYSETENGTLIRHDRNPYVSEKAKLQLLADVVKRGSDQLICFLHGPGGSGKTTVIDLVMKYGQEFASYLQTFKFTRQTIVVTAMTGVAATLLLGDTTHSALYLNQKRPLEAGQIEYWAETRLVIIDEISFASKQDFIEFHKKLRRLKQQIHLKYGGVSIVFSGDMRQLEPVGGLKKPVYEENCAEFKDWVNCYIELKGMHRFKDDMEWGKLLMRFRNGEVTPDDIKLVNERVVKKNDVLPENIRYATFFNRDRDAINTALFEERCKKIYSEHGSCNDSLLVFSDNILVQDGERKYVPFKHLQTFWENCGEDNVKVGRGQGRMDPVLKFYSGCRIMLPSNTNVPEGQANGTQAIVEKVVLKSGEVPQDVVIAGSIPVPAVFASQISYIVLRHSNSRIEDPVFTIAPKPHVIKAHILKPRCLQIKGNEREVLKLKATQVPFIINNASTGHKLQGAGVDCLFVHNWSYVTNWVYVMLSRVKTRSGLYCRKPIDTDVKRYAVPESLKKMLRSFSNRSPTYWSELDYTRLFDL